MSLMLICLVMMSDSSFDEKMTKNGIRLFLDLRMERGYIKSLFRFLNITNGTLRISGRKLQQHISKV